MTGYFRQSNVDANIKGAQKNRRRNNYKLDPINPTKRLLPSVNYFFINNALFNNLQTNLIGNFKPSIDKGVMKLYTRQVSRALNLPLKMAFEFENKNQDKSN